MNLIVRIPAAAPPPPDSAQIMQVLRAISNQVEGKPVLMCRTARWNYWVVRLSTKEAIIEALLLGMCPKHRGNAWQEACTACQIDQGLREGLCVWDEFAQVCAHAASLSLGLLE